MAGPNNDLIVPIGVDPAGISKGLESALAQITRFQTTVKRASSLGIDPINIDTSKLIASLNKAGLSVDQFFAGMKEEVAVTNAAMKQARMAEELDNIGRAALRAGEGAKAWERGMANIQKANAAAVPALDAHSNSAKRAASSLGILAAQAVGVQGPVGRLAEVALFASGGLGTLAAVSVTVLALAKAWEVLTAREREARKVHDDLVHSFSQRVEGVTAGSPASQRGAARAEVDRLVVHEAQLEREMAAFGHDIVGNLVRRGILHFEIIQRKKLELQLTQDEARAEKDRAQAAVSAALAGVDQMLAAHDRIRHAIEAGTKAARDAQSQLAALGPQTFGSQPGTLSNEEKAAFATRVQLAQAVTAEDIKSLQVQRDRAKQDLAIAAGQGKLTDAAKIEGQTRINLLTAAIQLRQLEGAEQVKAILREQKLGAATRQRILDEQAHLNRVAAAGGGNLPQGAGGIVPPISTGLPPILQGAREAGIMSDAVGHAAEQSRKLETALLGVLDVAGALSDAFGITDDRISQALRSAEGLVASIASGNVFGAISAGISFIGGLFGGKKSKDPERLATNQRLFEAAIRGDQEALEQLRIRSTVSRPGVPGTGSAKAAADAQKKYEEAIKSGTTSVKEFSDALNAATRNVPVGFPIERFRTAATTPEPIGGPVTVTPPADQPGGSRTRGGDARRERGGSFNIVLKVDGRDLHTSVVSIEEKKSMRKFGHPDGSSRGARWPN